MAEVLQGGTAAIMIFIGIFFFRFWHKTRDRFFLYFAGAFWIEGVDRVVLAAYPFASEHEPLFYLVRLISYGLIILAIWQKNRRRG